MDGGGGWTRVIFMSNPTFVWIGCVELWLNWGCENLENINIFKRLNHVILELVDLK